MRTFAQRLQRQTPLEKEDSLYCVEQDPRGE